MLRALIVDDERLARVALRALLEERDDVEVVGEADSVEAARDQLSLLHPDVVFLDVQMPGGSGFELFREPVSSKVVFCTAYEQYAVRAFEVNALDYLVKPVTPDHLARALQRLPLSPVVRSDAVAAEELVAQDLVALPEAHGVRMTKVRDIMFIQAADDYSEVHLVHGSSALVNITLRRWEQRLPDSDFIRIHRSTLVGVHHISAVRHEGSRFQVVLANGPQLAVSRRMASELKERLRATLVPAL